MSAAPSVANDDQPAPEAQDNKSQVSDALKTPKNDRFYELWDKFAFRPPPPKRSEIPSLDADAENHPTHLLRRNTLGIVSSEKATTSFDEAAEACKSKVAAIVKECKRLNLKYTDRVFRVGQYDTLVSLGEKEKPDSVNEQGEFSGSVKRVEDIFDKPEFIIDGATANDVRQGSVGDCWFVAAVTALSGTEEPGQELHLLQRLCVARDEKVGVYGFVFHRDGEWISEVVDDRLCLSEPSGYLELLPKKVRDFYGRGSDALYFASCRGSNETWLPLLEKAYAKAHGDYQSIEGGIPGEGIEDLTGGVSVSIATEDILDKDIMWEELKLVNKDFLFGCGSRFGTDSEPSDAEGFVRGHAYTVLEAREVGEERLLKIRNPWGKQEWNGPFSDGSKEWTPDLMKALNHTFGDDGFFWIRFKDFTEYYPHLDRTRLFGPGWTVNQQWTSVEVPFNAEYLPTRFTLDVKEKGPLVIVLAKPDERYFSGFEGRYVFDLHFRLYREGEETYLLRSIAHSGSGRSCSAEFDAEPGKYTVLVKVTADRMDEASTPEELIRKYRRSRRDKLLAVGTSYDLIHSKGLLREAENALAAREKADSRKDAKQRKVSVMKAERASVRETKRKEKLRVKRIDEEMKRKKAARKSRKEQEKQEKPVEATNGADKKTNDGEQDKKSETPVTDQSTAGTSESTINAGEPKETGKTNGEAVKETDATEFVGDGPSADKDAVSQEDGKETGAKEDSKGDGVNGEKSKPSTEEDEDEDEEAEDPESDVSAVGDDDFDWDSDLDDPVDLVEMPEAEDAEDEIFPDDPWNAICVVGLRVYAKGGGAKIGVVKS